MFLLVGGVIQILYRFIQIFFTDLRFHSFFLVSYLGPSERMQPGSPGRASTAANPPPRHPSHVPGPLTRGPRSAGGHGGVQCDVRLLHRAVRAGAARPAGPLAPGGVPSPFGLVALSGDPPPAAVPGGEGNAAAARPPHHLLG